MSAVSPATLLDFARVNDAAAATTKKLEKYAILAGYFHSLEDDEDLRRAVRFAGGRTFAATDERVLSVGGAIVSDVILRLLRVDAQLYHDTAVASGEIGEALAKLWPASPRLAASRDEPLTLANLSETFNALAATGNVQRKSDLLADLFSRCIDPREAAYAAKIIFGDLRTGVQGGVLLDAIARGFERPRGAVHRAYLLVGDLGDVAVLARHDQLATAAFTLFHPVQFMLATPQETPEAAARTIAAAGGRAFVAEDKLDGIRAQVHKQGDRIAIYTRTMDRADESFPDVVAAIARIPGDFLLDGEIVPFNDGQVLPFAHIQKRLGRKALTAKIIRDNPAALIAFDILYRDGELLMEKPLRERRKALENLVEPTLVSPSSDQTKGDTSVAPTNVILVTTAEEIDHAFGAARDSRNEGLVLKDPESPYSPGRRGKAWLKLKTHLPAFDCVVTFAETGHGKRRNSLSDYTFAVWDRDPAEEGAQLVNVGKAFSGVTDAEIAQLTELFTAETIQLTGGRVRQVKPHVVLEIACDQIQKSARHASGYALRFPRIKRIRWDKSPDQADRLERLIELYRSPANFGRSDVRIVTPEPTLFDAP